MFQNLSYVLFCASVYVLSLTVIYQNALDDSKRSVLQNGTTLLVIAHPDDEAMFFGPTIIRKLGYSVAGHDSNNNIDENTDDNTDNRPPNERFYLLCVTSGDPKSEKKGVRHAELIKSAAKLGVLAENVRVLDDVRWLDGENQVWHQADLQQLLMKEILSKNITELITFDSYGVSGHANHRTVYSVVRSISLKINYIKFYTLQSINLVQKYLAFFDFPFFYLVAGRDKASQVYVLGIEEYFRLVEAFRCHHSQVVWFRRLYTIFSKYMYVNVISELDPYV